MPAPPSTPTSPPEYPRAEWVRDLFAELRYVRDLIENRRKPTLTVGEVAALVGRDEYTVRHWIKLGRLRAARVPGTGPRGRLLIDRGELDRLLAAGLAADVPDDALGAAGPTE